MNTKNLSTLKIHKLTQVQYDRELAAGRIDEDALYLTPDDGYSAEEIDIIISNKADVDHTHSISNIDNLQETLDSHDIAIDELNEEVSIDYSQIEFNTGSEYEDSGIDFSVYQTKADGTLSTTAKTVSGAINELDAGIDNEASLRTEADNVLDGKIAQISNPNLLINSDFRNPINQREKTTYTGTGGTRIYTIDRWTVWGVLDTTINNGYITLTNRSASSKVGHAQIFETPLEVGQTYTMSANINGNIITRQFVGGTAFSDEYLYYAASSTTIPYDRVGIDCPPSGSIDIYWMKLEKGSVATPFVPRLYGEELALCQRYYFRMKQPSAGFNDKISPLYYFTPYSFPQNMRVAPSVSDFKLYDSSYNLQSSITLTEMHAGMTCVQDIKVSATKGDNIFFAACFDAEIY